MVGGLVMAVLNSGLYLMGVGAERQQVIKGLVLLAAVAFDVYNKQQGRPSITGRLFNRKPPATVGGSSEPADSSEFVVLGSAAADGSAILAGPGTATSAAPEGGFTTG